MKCYFNRVAKQLIEITLQHGWSTVNLLHIFRAPLPRNTSGGRLLMLDMFVFGFDKLKKVKRLDDRPTAKKVYIFGVFLVRIFPHSDWIRTRKTPNTDTFHAVTFIAWTQNSTMINFYHLEKSDEQVLNKINI